MKYYSSSSFYKIGDKVAFPMYSHESEPAIIVVAKITDYHVNSSTDKIIKDEYRERYKVTITLNKRAPLNYWYYEYEITTLVARKII
jgi:hypothetical protein